ncbi:rab guanine nucleotide exchange factor S2 [Rhizoclosmatium sp. JEL0117]|nr:rab guanine nucleotide exchange factor S2 [Rhizoclosmatium sp. JEL0117]
MEDTTGQSALISSSTPILSNMQDDTSGEETIALLEKRISDLEATHKAALEKVSREKANLSQDLLKKNLIIDKMRIKLNRYEFSLKEAILFLTKPMDAYETWLNQKTSESNNVMVVNAIQGALNAANQVYAAGPSYLSGSQGNTLNTTPQQSGGTPNTQPSRSRNPSAVPAAPPPSPVKPHASNSASSLAIVTDSASLIPQIAAPPSPTVPKIGGATNLEIHCMECMRLSLNYLKNAQASINSMEKDDVVLTQIPAAAAPLLSDPLQLLNIKPLDEALEKLKNSLDSNGSTPPVKNGLSPENLLPVASTSGHSRTSTNQPNQPQNVSSAVAKSRALAYARINSPERRQSNQITNSALFRAATIISPIDDGNADDGDISSKKAGGSNNVSPNVSTTTPPVTNPSPQQTTLPAGQKCHKCREYMLQLDQYKDTMDTLRGDIRTLANQLEEERAIRDRNQLAKDILDQELEELTSQLFDQANKMVIDEARMRDELENSNRDLKGELKELVRRCEVREEELKELNRNLRALEAAKLRSSVLSINHDRDRSLPGSITNLSSPTSGSASSPTNNLFPKPNTSPHSLYASTPLFPPKSSTIPIDGLLLTEFQDHIRATLSTIASPTNPSPSPLSVALETLFMKRALLEDVEPCLFQNYPIHTLGPGGTLVSTKLPKTITLSNGLTQHKKRILDSLIKGLVEVYCISEHPSTQEPPPSPTQSQGQGHANRAKCAACLNQRDCDAKIRLTDKFPADSFPVCLFCRDKVVAVIDFYAYMAHLRQGVIGPGKQGVTMLGMLRHALWLKRRMGAARIGNCALFDEGVMVSADRAAGVGEWEKIATIIH